MAAPTRPNSTFETLGWTLQPDADGLARVTLLGRYPIKIRPELVDTIHAMEVAWIASGYENPCDWIGSWMYRSIAGTNGLASGHAYGVCVDLDYGGDNPDSPDHPGVDNNPHVHRRIVRGDPGFGREWQITEAQVDVVERIKNTAGEQIMSWRIGWLFGDTMHWQPRVGPDDCEVDWSTVYTGEEQDEDEDMTYEQFRAAEFDLWTDQNIVEAYDAGMFQDTNRAGFIDYWVTHRNQRTAPEKARFITDYYAHLWR